MKFEIKIPEGKYCGECPVFWTCYGEAFCVICTQDLRKDELKKYNRVLNTFEKHPNCPSLKLTQGKE